MKEKKLNIVLVPKKVEPFVEGSLEQDVVTQEADMVVYEPVQGETIIVLLWERYPSYDIIIGVPDKTNPRYEKEMGFMTVRKVGHISYTGLYFDLKECQAMVEGFSKVIENSRSHSPHLWKNHSMKM